VIGTRRWSNIVRRVQRLAVLLTSGAAVVLAVSDCSGSRDSPVATAVVRHERGLPPGVTESPETWTAATGIPKPFATWAESHEIYVTTWGSSSCPKLPTSVHAAGAHGVQINTAEHYLHKGDNACTSDLAPTTSTVRLPPEIDDTAALAVTIDGTPIELGPRTR